MSEPGVYTVIDIGGTSLRIGRYETATGRLTAVDRFPTDGLAVHPDHTAVPLQHRVSRQLVDRARQAVREHGSCAVGIAFAGPVTTDGWATAAPTIWGGGGPPVPVRALVEEQLRLPVVVVNDITAALWRYAEPSAGQVPFCLLTVSSGIGGKVYWNGEVLLDARGHGGELGHWRCDLSPQAPLCDCGGRGHLGALASGRAMQRIARRTAREDPAGFAASALSGPAGSADGITTYHLVEAVHADDAFATDILRGGLRHLARAVTSVFTSIGVTRYIVIGGFALAVGERYADMLTACLVEQGCFGLDTTQIRQMVSLGAADDDHGLLGIGRLLATRLPATSLAESAR
ncbi:ROK family protein [Micromonospora schwarzwaldensis]|uniref:ROK family protein n=1 Tax=Micromonospora sp. DSM 45708 TaxID=3111767 RepID=UPI0031E0A893